jgi:predicted nucleic-acid-binding protein
MIGLDTNILARYYIDDEDKEALGQHRIARDLIESGKDMMVCKTVLLEFEWVMRGYYGFKADEILGVFQHLLSLEQISIEDRHLVERALDSFAEGLDFADALHHASYHQCTSMVSFDDKKFARRIKKLSLMPTVAVPT